MAKIRGIKPDYWTDEDIVELSIPARLLFIGLWNYSCDNGHLQDKPKQIKMRILPADDVNVSELIRELATKGLVLRADGWITTPNLTKHQKPDRRYFATCDHPGCIPPPETVSQREARRVHAVQTPGTRSAHAGAHVDGDGDGDGEVISPVKPALRADEARPEITALCDRLAKAVEANGVPKPEYGKSWLTAARLLIDKDGYTVQQIEWMIDWATSDEFWRANILSMPKLRQQFPQLKLKSGVAKPSKPKHDPDWALKL